MDHQDSFINGTIRDLQSKNDVLKKQNSDLQTQMIQMKTQHQLKVQKLESRVDELLSINSSSLSRNQTLENDNSQFNAVISSLTSQCQDLRVQIDVYQKLLLQKDAQLQDFSSILKQQNNENKMLQTQIQELNDQIAALKVENESLKSNSQYLKVENEKLKSNFPKVKQLEAELKQTLEDLSAFQRLNEV
ncbi:Ig-like_domain repeat protein [Hexamita inflata]|uniref:Ig-like domain repeat protein n=1 Tax=Hexamita inflata TaxID=28002 RepID=A0AA86QZF9_9EUKA|nr:Ig-like domain repeat protein [Hexamita inflata]